MSNETYPLPIAVSVAGEEVNYHLRKTTAPKAYDGFGTLSIYEYKDLENPADSFRLVLIRDEHMSWQVPRYQSGNFAVLLPVDWEYADAIELLRKRMFTNES